MSSAPLWCGSCGDRTVAVSRSDIGWTLHSRSGSRIGFDDSLDRAVSSLHGDKDLVWRNPPSALERLVAELFEARPDDVLTWLHEAVWRHHALELVPSLSNTVSSPRLGESSRTVSRHPDSPSAVCGDSSPVLSTSTTHLRPQIVSTMTDGSSSGAPQSPRLAALVSAQEVGKAGVDEAAVTQPLMQPVGSSSGAGARRRGRSPAPAPGSAVAIGSSLQKERSPLGARVVENRSGASRAGEDMARGASRISEGGVRNLRSVDRDSRVSEETGEFMNGEGSYSNAIFKYFGRVSASPAAEDAPRRAKQESIKSNMDEQSDWGVLPPMGTTRLVWDQIFFLCLLYEMWATPMELCYGVEAMDKPRAFLVADMVVLGLFAVDIGFNFNTGYVKGDLLIMRRRQIFMQYLKGWFWLDAFATIPDLVLAGLMSFSDQFSSIRILRTVKAYKLLKAIKLVRSMRLLRSQSMANKVMAHFDFSSNALFAAQLIQGHICLLILVHFNAVIWAGWQQEWPDNVGLAPEEVPDVTMKMAMQRYTISLGMTYSAMTFGNDMPANNSTQEFLGILMAMERGTVFVLVSAWLLWRMLRISKASAGEVVAKELALGYLKHHRVSTAIQLKVFRTLNEASLLRRQKDTFNRLALEAFPTQLRQSVLYELWSQRLMTLDIFLHISGWRTHFLKELTLSVHEEVIPSQVVVFSAGDASDAAYLVLRGMLAVTWCEYDMRVPDLTPGMWFGEKALVNTDLRRVETVVCKALSQLMVVPAEPFFKLLAKFELKDDFNKLLNDNLWLGLCGRCGVLGDHYSTSCPHNEYQEKARTFVTASNPAPHRAGPALSSGRTRSWKGALNASRIASAFSSERDSQSHGNGHSHGHQSGSDLGQFLQAHQLAHLCQHMGRHGIFNLNDLKFSSVEALRADPLVQLTKDEEQILSESAVHEFRKKMRRATSKLLIKVEEQHHLIFLSHYKAEAGSTAALMQDAMSRMLKEDKAAPGHGMEAPVFLDTEELRDLNDIKRHVVRSHNLVLLLTKGVLSRPWCLLEIVMAVRAGTTILPVKVEEPGACFVFPDEVFYSRLRDGLELDESCFQFLRSEGVELEELERALRQVFRRIAMPFSPHKSANIRLAELRDLLKECRLRQRKNSAFLRRHGDSGSSRRGMSGNDVNCMGSMLDSAGSSVEEERGVQKVASTGSQESRKSLESSRSSASGGAGASAAPDGTNSGTAGDVVDIDGGDIEVVVEGRKMTKISEVGSVDEGHSGDSSAEWTPAFSLVPAGASGPFSRSDPQWSL